MQNCRKRALFSVLIFLTAAAMAQDAIPVRIKDIAHIQGVRENQLVGLGIISGLAGKGDSSESPLLKQALSNLLNSFDLALEPGEIKSKNTAIVMVTADMPSYARAGDRISVNVSSLSDAKSLDGGVLLQTTLKAANGSVYAVAQGMVAAPATQGSPTTVGAIPGGAIVEQDVISAPAGADGISIVLRNPDFTTALAVEQEIDKLGIDVDAAAIDASMIQVTRTDSEAPDGVALISLLENVMVVPDTEARVVINPRAGVVVMGKDVKIGTVAVSYRGTKIDIGSSRRRTAGPEENFVMEGNATVGELIDVLQGAGLKTDTIVEILKAVERAGALYGRLVIM